MPQSGGKRPALNFLPALSALVFLLTLAAGAGFFIWQLTLSQRIGTLTEKIAEAREAFEPEVIERLRQIDLRIQTARQIVRNHTDPSGLFEILSSDTLRNVAFRRFAYTTKNAHSANVAMSGEALDFATLALQADVFAKNTNIVNPAFSRFGKSTQKLVTFEFDAGLDPNLIVYRAPAASGSNTIPADLMPATNATSSASGAGTATTTP